MINMKKILSALLIVLFLATQAWPAALTLTNESHSIIGNLRVVTGTASVTSGDTLAVGLSTILFVGYAIRTTAGSPAGPDNVGHRISGTTVTFTTATDALTWEFFIVGF